MIVWCPALLLSGGDSASRNRALEGMESTPIVEFMTGVQRRNHMTLKRPGGSKPRWGPATAVVIAAILVFVAVVPAVAQDGGEITSWGLLRVIVDETGDIGRDLYPTDWSQIRADSTGGEILYITRWVGNESCYIQSRLKWVFNRDVSRVDQGDIIEVTLYNTLEGFYFCGDLGGNQVPRIEAHGSNNGSAGGTELLPDGLDPAGKYWSDGQSERIYGIEQPQTVTPRAVGVGKCAIEINDQTSIGYEQDSQHGFFTIEIAGTVLLDIVYLYDANQIGTALVPPIAFNSPPRAPVLVYPYNAWCPALDPNDITFQWQDYGDPDGDAVVFQIEIQQYDESTETWSQVYISDDLSATQYAMQGFALDAYYAWRVFAIDRAGRSDPYYTASDWLFFSTAINYCSW